jgi:hypothetical protein
VNRPDIFGPAPEVFVIINLDSLVKMATTFGVVLGGAGIAAVAAGDYPVRIDFK